jgi:hypothetical protein
MRLIVTVHRLLPPLTRAGELVLRIGVGDQTVVMPIRSEEEVPFDIDFSEDRWAITPYPDIPREDAP